MLVVPRGVSPFTYWFAMPMGELTVSLPPVSTMLDSQQPKWGLDGFEGGVDSSYYFQDHSLYLEIAPVPQEVDYYKCREEGDLLGDSRQDTSRASPGPVYTNLDESTRQYSAGVDLKSESEVTFRL